MAESALRPSRCPNGHELRGRSSTSWDMEDKCHVLFCSRCDSRISLKAGAEWEVYIAGQWVKPV